MKDVGLKISALLFVLVLIGGAYWYKYHRVQSPTTSQESVRRSASVRTVRVIDGREFEFALSDGSRVFGFLKGGVSTEAKDEVVRLMNSVAQCRIEMIEQTDKGWIVDVFLKLKSGDSWTSQEVSLWTWLEQKKLTYPTVQKK